MPKPQVTVTQMTRFCVTLNRDLLELALLEWLEYHRPETKLRDEGKVTFNHNDDGELTGAMIDVLAPQSAPPRVAAHGEQPA
jgi:hypothetical protein